MISIVFEGPDGVGKTTQAKLLAKSLPDAYYFNSPFFNNCDNGYSFKLIKELLQNRVAIEEPKIFQKLFSDNRNSWINECQILESKHTKYVIIDRWNLSTFLYGKMLCISDRKYLKSLVKADLNIDIQFLFQNNSGFSFRKNPDDVFEKERYDSICHVYSTYIKREQSNQESDDDSEIIKLLPKNNILIDCNQSIEIIQQEIFKYVCGFSKS